MAIEFRCTECGKLLRVADETAGKQAKCPACGAIAPIPPKGKPFDALPSTSQAESNPFAVATPNVQPMPSGPEGEFNPYQAPSQAAPDLLHGYTPFGTAWDAATPGARLGAKLLDVVIVALALFFALIVAGVLGFLNDRANPDVKSLGLLCMLSGPIVISILQWVLIAQRGQTIGKIALGIRIVDVRSGEIPGFLQGVVLRIWLPMFIMLFVCPGVLFGIIDAMMVFSADQRCLHDHMAQTRVINAKT